MEKILFIAPHLSTGGLPQYLVKKVELLKGEFEVYLIEYNNSTGGKLVIQKNKILDLVDEDKFFMLDDNKEETLEIIKNIKPDIVHLEEIPEYFMSYDLARKIYNVDREYFIVETSHDSSFNTNHKIFFPDKFMFVSDWQIQQYKNIDIPKILVEYPIEYQERLHRVKTLIKLGLDPSKKHILHVGLFTPRKNQAEFFEYARSLPEYQFHCLGNQAGNFEYYWKPLMEDKPDNIVWWNERTDVERFYGCMDLFLFTSRGSDNDKETMPLVIREAISHQIPQLLYNLPVYLNYFDKFDSIDYLNYDDLDSNINLIRSTLNKDGINPSEEAYVVCTYPVSDAITQTTKECIESLKKDGRKIIISAHTPVPKELQKMVDYTFNDSNNILTKHTYYSGYTYHTDLYNTHVNLRGENNDRYHGPACYTSFFNPATFAKSLGIKKLHFINFDYILKDKSYIDYISNILNKKDTFFGEYQAQEGPCYYTYFFSAKPEAMLEVMPTIHTAREYDNLMDKFGAESNGIENLTYHMFKDYDNNHIEPKELFDSNAEKYFEFEDYSMVEYYTILPTDVDNHFCPWVTISNAKESKLIHYTVIKNGELIIDRKLEVRGKYSFWDLVKYNLSDNFSVKFEVSDLESGEHIITHKFDLNEDYFLNIMPNNGSFKWKGNRDEYENKKIKLLHLVTEPKTNKKEIRSIKNIKDFCKKMDIVYDQRINKIWKKTPPSSTCNRPNDVQDKPGYYKLAPGHYGCYLAHKNAICHGTNSDYDYILIFEGDVIIDSDYNELYESLKRFSRIAKEQDQDLIGFGNPHQNRNLNGPKVEDIYTDVTPFIPAQSYLINNDKLDKIKNKFNNLPWDAFDMWICNVAQLKVGTAEKIYTKHLPGFSIIEQEFKSTDENSPLIYADE